MSILIRKCRFADYRWYTKLMKKRELCFPTLSNQKVMRNLCSAHLSQNNLHDRIRRYLDYLVNQYKNKTLKDKSLLEIIDLINTNGLLNKRIQLVENIQNLQDLGK